MKIAYVCSNYAPFVGGVEIHAQQAAQWMVRKHEVAVAARNFVPCRRAGALAVLHHSLLTPAWRDSVDGAVPVYSLTPDLRERMLMAPLALRVMPKLRRWFYEPINRLTHPFYRLAVQRKLTAVLAKADVVHCLAHGDLGWAALAMAQRANLPFVCTPFVHPRQWGDGAADVDYYRECDAVIGLVDSDARYLRSLGVDQGRVHVIGVSPHLPAQADGARFRAKYDLANKRIILYVGRMMPQKGAAAVVQAARLVSEQRDDVAFVFIGPASEAEAAVFADAPICVHYLGKVDIQDKADAYAACDMFCMPSLSEILPTVYLEAWSYAKPVIGGLAEGLSELVAGNNAGVNVPQDPRRIAAAVAEYLQQPALAETHGSYGRELVAQRYSSDAVGSQLEQLYLRVVAARRGESTLHVTRETASCDS